MTIAERITAYRTAFPQYPDSWPVAQTGRWMNATWMLGNNYQGSGYYGAYPPAYLRRMAPMFIDKSRVLHLFAGSLPDGSYTRVDLQPFHPIHSDRYPNSQSFVLNAETELFPTFSSSAFDIIYADPPYSKMDAAKYNTKMINRRQVFKQCWLVLAPGGILAWMDVILPMYRKTNWLHWGNIHLIRSTNHRVRLVSLFERQP